MWVTAVLYMRHLVPRKYTACGQALPVITHFCLGRVFGSLFGGIGYTGRRGDFINVHYWFAVAAAFIGIVYFLVFHFYLKPYCVAPIQRPPKPAPSVVQSKWCLLLTKKNDFYVTFYRCERKWIVHAATSLSQWKCKERSIPILKRVLLCRI